MIRPSQTIRRAIRTICCVLLATSPCLRSAIASDPSLSGRANAKISKVGDCETKIVLQTKLTHYTALKKLGSNFNLLARKIGMDDRNWSKKNGLAGEFIDSNNEVDMTFSTPGAARIVKGNHWILPLHGDENSQLVTASDSRVILMSAESTAVGLGTMIIDVELPEGATHATFDHQKKEISYDFTPQIEDGTRAELSFEVDHKTTLMSCLAKNYSNSKFNYMWAARAVAKNNGDQILNDYRVRFRVAEMGSWGAWQRSARLYPGQTVVDPFFPVFDLDKVMAMNGSRPAVIEVEYEYAKGDGSKVHESDSYPVQVLSRNEVVYSSLKPSDITGFDDQFDYGAALMTSMTTPADPVVQQLSGRVNGMAAETFGQSIAAGQTDQECLCYMYSLHNFIQANKIAYQSPPGMLTQGNAGQHIKYTRDVLRNRAGTCVDLAITWASVCEAAGLETAIVVCHLEGSGGHAFPAVKLPQSRTWAPIEATKLDGDFKSARAAGDTIMKRALAGNHILVDISTVRHAGVLGLDLPNVSEEYLTKLGYSFVASKLPAAPAEKTTPAQQTAPAQQTVPAQQAKQTVPAQQTAQQTAQQPPVQQTANEEVTTFNPNGHRTAVGSLIGTWVGFGVRDGEQTGIGLAINGDASFKLLYRTTNEDQTTNDIIHIGTWGKRDHKVVFTINGTAYDYEFEFTGDKFKLCILGGDQVITMFRQP